MGVSFFPLEIIVALPAPEMVSLSLLVDECSLVIKISSETICLPLLNWIIKSPSQGVRALILLTSLRASKISSKVLPMGLVFFKLGALTIRVGHFCRGAATKDVESNTRVRDVKIGWGIFEDLFSSDVCCLSWPIFDF